ncbi:uncharacterized protein LOC113360011 [Papaver somniferum]|uniref:uncharacterized protein LOC113360011 n=1 Tax=Papaver somniferum TaxID=3469 RepID=UPI000E6FACD8|nr:uncharacterized protein LOC113360011 [Papaver somniferum]
MDTVFNLLNTMTITHHLWDIIKTNLLAVMHILDNLMIMNGLQDMQQRLDQLHRDRKNVAQTNFCNTFSYPTLDRSYDHSPIQREESWEREPIVANGGKCVNVRKLAHKLYKLKDDGASEELVDEISRTIHMELKRRRDKGGDNAYDGAAPSGMVRMHWLA